jgi:hypothetical protein
MSQNTYIPRKGQDADFAAVTATSITLTDAYNFAWGDDVDQEMGDSADVLLRFSTADASNAAFVVALDDTSQQVHITDKAAVATDWARNAGTHPEVAIHSNTTPITDYLAIGNHDGTTASIDVVGGTTLALKIAGTTAASLTAGGLAVTAASGVTTVGPIVKLTQTVGFAAFTDGLGTSGTFDLTVGTIPAGAYFLASSVTAVTGFAGDTSAVMTIGDGTTADRYNTGTINVFATAANGIAAGVPSGVRYHDTAKTVKLTVTSAADFTNVSAGSVTVELYYLT